MPDGALDHLRALGLALPAVTERLSHGEPTWFVEGKKTFVSGWVGVRLDVPDVDWAEIADLVQDAYRQVAPKRLVAQLDATAASCTAPRALRM